MRLIRDMLIFEPQSGKTDIRLALKEAASLMKKRGIIFLLSDLLSDDSPALELKMLNRRQDVVAVKLIDPVEKNWQVTTPALLEDAETGEMIQFDGSRSSRTLINQHLQSLHESHRELCRSAKIDLIEIESGQDVLKPLITFFNQRKRRISRRS